MSAPLGWKWAFDDRILAQDSLHVFMMSMQAMAPQAKVIAEVGCGRGALVDLDEPNGSWNDLRGPGRKVIGIDIDPAGAENPTVDEFRLIGEDYRWPLDDASIDLAVSDYVLEHVGDPEAFVAELTRTLRPGGAFVARTVSRSSPLSMFARLVPNRSHAGVLAYVQKGRQQKDVFPTVYKMNTRQALDTYFSRDYEWAAASRTGLDLYLVPWPRLAKSVVALERRLPRSLQSSLVICARKRS